MLLWIVPYSQLVRCSWQVGVEDISFKGRLRTTMIPLLFEMPVVGAIQVNIFCMDTCASGPKLLQPLLPMVAIISCIALISTFKSAGANPNAACHGSIVSVGAQRVGQELAQRPSAFTAAPSTGASHLLAMK